MVGDMDNTGSLNAQFIHQLTTHVRSKVALQVSTAHWRNASANKHTHFVVCYLYMEFYYLHNNKMESVRFSHLEVFVLKGTVSIKGLRKVSMWNLSILSIYRIRPN